MISIKDNRIKDDIYKVKIKIDSNLILSNFNH